MEDKAYDLIVLGSGAAGLTAALTAAEYGARVLVVEKGEKLGGTSAWSGGQIWIPCNPHQKAYGKEDSKEKALTYLASMSNGLIEPEMAGAYIDGGIEMVTFLEERTPVQFMVVPHFPDYHPEQPGAASRGGRTLECAVYPYGELGEWRDKVEVSPYYWPHVYFTVGETSLAQAVPDPLDPAEARRRADNDERGLGHALVGRLLRGCLDRGVAFELGTGGRELLTEDGVVTGVELADGRRIDARNVVLATGGFEYNEVFKAAFLRGPLTSPVSIKTNTGDGLRMAMKAGAMLGAMREAWWMPVVEAPLNPMGRMLFTGERTLPGTIMVNRTGKRFTNEAANYNAFGAAFHEQDQNSCSWKNLPAWCVFNQAFHDKWGFLDTQLIGVGDEGHEREPADWIERGATLAELAGKLGIPADALEATVERWNRMVESGKDEDFGRGESYYDVYWGDPDHKGRKEATLGKLEGGPYYAAEVKSGALGTKGGPRTDTLGRVVDVDMKPIEGLYAAGNAMGSMMGMTYGGGGGTLGPGMVFGYLAGKHGAQRNAGAGAAKAATERA
ncbi:FAD-binding protein [Novosphingobium endophyticum]|uniref:FAD-binding protein n=1 Tax=Novosphingobium endophyticum TaxID=1955250 RepID=A0A916X721_9SPHN|nr:FAD-dependent oxidoreductase [Novosphingobium endophyticum]GGC13673.1 FAD-binding protein [Novosphingobium endophyticum]